MKRKYLSVLLKHKLFSLSGRINLFESFTARFPCQGNYKRFPFDIVSCNMFVGGMTPPAVVDMNWLGGKPLFFPPWVKTSSFDLKGFDFTEDLRTLDPQNIIEYVTSTYVEANSTAVSVSLNLRRKYSYYILAMYLPNIVIVIIAWMSMWFPFDGTRMNICKFCSRLIVSKIKNMEQKEKYFNSNRGRRFLLR